VMPGVRTRTPAAHAARLAMFGTLSQYDDARRLGRRLAPGFVEIVRPWMTRVDAEKHVGLTPRRSP
jgi:hypothetical protein